MVVQPMPGIKVIFKNNDTICEINRNSHIKCCGKLFGFRKEFFYISLSASSKSCLFVDI
jgi:hypothetical protein